jgi:hypothetical protein
MAETPRRNIRVSDDDWLPASRRAREAGVTLSELIRGWVAEYGTGRMVSAPQPRFADWLEWVADGLGDMAGRLRRPNTEEPAGQLPLAL